MKQKVYKIFIKELPIILYQNGSISKNKLDEINQFVVDNDKDSFRAELAKLNVNLSEILFETDEVLDSMEFKYMIADPEHPIGKEEKYNSIW